MPKVPPEIAFQNHVRANSSARSSWCRGLENMKISGKWLHPDSFKDEYLSERMRLQLWTLCIE